MKNHRAKKYLTFGEFVERVYDVCGKRKEEGIVRIAIKVHLIEFRNLTL